MTQEWVKLNSEELPPRTLNEEANLAVIGAQLVAAELGHPARISVAPSQRDLANEIATLPGVRTVGKRGLSFDVEPPTNSVPPTRRSSS